ncbi:hypothetical protein [Streptomyces sp. CT34]|uniref:hypothetical protein n=1 Tax=Streptomyces sp. CT34 TaxID=1553907 RepID=UPI0005BA7728|nr:hypothetical protein [Streptomyces sp. CT34]
MSSADWSQQRKAGGTPVVRVHFALADGIACPLKARCTKAANGKWGRSLTPPLGSVPTILMDCDFPVTPSLVRS